MNETQPCLLAGSIPHCTMNCSKWDKAGEYLPLDAPPEPQTELGPQAGDSGERAAETERGLCGPGWERFPGSDSLILLSQGAAAKNTTSLLLHSWEKTGQG